MESGSRTGARHDPSIGRISKAGAERPPQAMNSTGIRHVVLWHFEVSSNDTPTKGTSQQSE